MCPPPPQVSCGFCIFNNVAVGAMHALSHHNLERVAIVDIDVHHGNGTEEICRSFPEPNRLLFFSVHLYDRVRKKQKRGETRWIDRSIDRAS